MLFHAIFLHRVSDDEDNVPGTPPHEMSDLVEQADDTNDWQAHLRRLRSETMAAIAAQPQSPVSDAVAPMVVDTVTNILKQGALASPWHQVEAGCIGDDVKTEEKEDNKKDKDQGRIWDSMDEDLDFRFFHLDDKCDDGIVGETSVHLRKSAMENLKKLGTKMTCDIIEPCALCVLSVGLSLTCVSSG